MDLSKLASQPQLIELTINDEETIERYGEAMTFWIYDRQNVETFVKMASIQESDFAQASNLVKDLILDKDGNQILKDNDTLLPADLQIKAITTVVEELGKLITTPSEKKTET